MTFLAEFTLFADLGRDLGRVLETRTEVALVQPSNLEQVNELLAAACVDSPVSLVSSHVVGDQTYTAGAELPAGGGDDPTIYRDKLIGTYEHILELNSDPSNPQSLQPQQQADLRDVIAKLQGGEDGVVRLELDINAASQDVLKARREVASVHERGGGGQASSPAEDTQAQLASASGNLCTDNDGGWEPNQGTMNIGQAGGGGPGSNLYCFVYNSLAWVGVDPSGSWSRSAFMNHCADAYEHESWFCLTSPRVTRLGSRAGVRAVNHAIPR